MGARVVLDACVLFPTVMREALLAAARAGFYEPVWSQRILDEVSGAARRIDAIAYDVAKSDIFVMQREFFCALYTPNMAREAELWLPDSGDLHVLNAAIEARADCIVTRNAKDFPRKILAGYGVNRDDPDAFLVRFSYEYPDEIYQAMCPIVERAQVLSGHHWTGRDLFKKARLPRLGKFMMRYDQ